MRSGQQTKYQKSFKERLEAIHFSMDKIPERYIDDYVTKDIMLWPIEVIGARGGKYIMDHSSLMKFSLVKLKEWEEKTRNGEVYYDAVEHPGLVSIGGGNEEMLQWRHLHDLREEIDGWVFLQELEDKLRTRAEKKAEVLEQFEGAIKAIHTEVERLLDPMNEAPASDKERELNVLLLRLDLFNKAKKKLTLGSRYYDEPGVLEYEIQRLLAKQEKSRLTEEESEELALCYERLDRQGHDKRNGITYYRPGLLQLIGFHAIPERDQALNPARGIPVLRMPGLRRKEEEF